MVPFIFSASLLFLAVVSLFATLFINHPTSSKLNNTKIRIVIHPKLSPLMRDQIELLSSYLPGSQMPFVPLHDPDIEILSIVTVHPVRKIITQISIIIINLVCSFLCWNFRSTLPQFHTLTKSIYLSPTSGDIKFINHWQQLVLLHVRIATVAPDITTFFWNFLFKSALQH